MNIIAKINWNPRCFVNKESLLPFRKVMQRRLCVHMIFLVGILLFADAVRANEPDSVYVFAYNTAKNDYHNGLHIAWSIDKKNWEGIGEEYSFLRSDYGQWGQQKKMKDVFLFYSPQGRWHCVWSLNDEDGAFAHAESADLINWKSQSYPLVMPKGNCLKPYIEFDKESGRYIVGWHSTNHGEQNYVVTTSDFKTYSSAKVLEGHVMERTQVIVNQELQSGTVHKVAWSVLDKLIKSYQISSFNLKQNQEVAADDGIRFKDLKPVHAVLNFGGAEPKNISNLMVGAFFEDINYAADGGLYAELVQNRGFEYSSNIRKEWNSLTAWRAREKGDELKIGTEDPIHVNNTNYLILDARTNGGVINEGFGGIAVRGAEKYLFSVFARDIGKKGGRLIVRLLDKSGNIIGEGKTAALTNKWKKLEVNITAHATAADAELLIVPEGCQTVNLDMVSLFPEKTFKNRRNGMRLDLAEILADMKPKFIRFPGGCVSHGNGLDNIYHWKNTIGSLESRKPQRNLWGYHQSYGLGFYEYFQFCEDLGAEPVPVVAAGVPCQNSAHNGHALGGQQCGIPLADMDAYIQDILDLIEYANGSASTVWGKKRIEAGHVKPFNLKYLGVGNEDLITDIFKERFTMIYEAVKRKYPEIIVIGTTGPFYEGSDYVEGWELATELEVPMVDEHYYNPPGWYINNQDFYDRYDRSKSKVYVGEYAAHLPNRKNSIETALAEAIHLCNIERNGDIVAMTSYAPLLAKIGNTQWNPDLIYFDNEKVYPTVGYYVQQLFGKYSGDEYLPNLVQLDNRDTNVRKRIAASVVRDSKTGEVFVRLVNLLPVEVNIELSSSDKGMELPKSGNAFFLSGKPDSTTAVPVTKTLTLDQIRLDPYSFTLISLGVVH